MKTCNSCNEINGDNRSTCWKCGNNLPVTPGYKKICPQCNTIYAPSAATCSNCHVQLGVFDDRQTSSYSSSSNDGCWMYIVAVIVPFVGIVLGLVYIARGDDELGKSLILTGIVAPIIISILIFAVGGCGLMFY